jgi:cytochrome c556
MKRLLVAFAVLAATPILSATPGLADPVTVPSDTIIGARQTTFLLSSFVFLGIKAAVTSGADPKHYADSAGALVEWAGIIPTLFPPGTEKGHDSKALSKIWTDTAGFEKAAANYAEAAKTLQAAAKAGDAKAFAAAFKQTGKACGACHKAYRAKEDE